MLVSADDARAVTGVIDFGDIVRSPLIVDVAVAAAYLLRDSGDALADVLVFVAAYNAVESLEADELAVLFDLILTRSTMTILISRWRAARYPDNRDYILRSEPMARKRLETMGAEPAASVAARLADACNS